jgi:16S rRNA G966 N2-methylase RsmD
MHDWIIEPFAGSACYATRYANRQVALVEHDPEIAALWAYLIAGNADEIAGLPTTELREGQNIRELGCSYGAALLIRQWQRVGMSKCWTVSKWCNKDSMWGNSTRDSVAESVSQIKHWALFAGDYRMLANHTATWFIDPPYAGLNLYGAKNFDFAQCADWCKSRNGQVIVCEQASATWLPFEPFRRVLTGRHGYSAEGIWTK